MKITNKLCTVALVAVLGSTAVLPGVALAATEWSGAGNITFTEDTTTPPVTPPGTDEPEITEPPVNPDPAALKIVSVSDLDFGSKTIKSDDSDDSYPASVFEAPIKDKPGETITMPNFVRFQDKRADGEENFYKIEAQLTSQFTNGASTLKAASLSYSNATLVTGTNTSTLPTNDAVETAFDVTSEDKTPVLNNNQTGKGYGVFEIMFGDLTADTADKSVHLNVPGNNVFKAGEYTGEITWFITEAK